MREYRNRPITSYKRRLKESVEVTKETDMEEFGYFDSISKNQLPVDVNMGLKISNIFVGIITDDVIPLIKSAVKNNCYLLNSSFEHLSVQDYLDNSDWGCHTGNSYGSHLYWIPIIGKCIDDYDYDTRECEAFADAVIDEIIPKISSIFDGIATRVKLSWEFNDYDLEEYIDDNSEILDDEDNPKWDEIFDNQPDSGINIGICIEASNELIKSFE